MARLPMRVVRPAAAVLSALCILLPATAFAGPVGAAGGRAARSGQEGWRILERVRRLAMASSVESGDAQRSAAREAVVTELEKLGWTARIVALGSEEGESGSARVMAVVAEKGTPGGDVVALGCRLPGGEGESASSHAASGAAVLFEVARLLETATPLRLWRLVFVEGGGSANGVSALRREAVRMGREKIVGFVSVERVGRSSPLVAIPFPEAGSRRPRSSPMGLYENLRGAAQAEGGGALFLGDSGSETMFQITSRLFGVGFPSLATPFSEERVPALLLTDASPSSTPEREGSGRGTELEPDRLAFTATLLRTFLLRVDAAPPVRAPDDVIAWNGRKIREDDARNLLLVVAILAAARMISFRRERRSTAVELAQLAASLLFAAGVIVPAIETPITAIFLLGAATVVAALVPPGRVTGLFLVLMCFAIPLARLIFYLEVQTGGSGAFPNGNLATLIHDPALALVVAGLAGSTIAGAYLRYPAKGSGRSAEKTKTEA